MIINSDTAGTGAFQRLVPADGHGRHPYRPELVVEWGYRLPCRVCHNDRLHELHRRQS